MTAKGRRTIRLALECLEDRAVPSVTVPSAGNPGPAVLTGGNGSDRFVIRLQPGTPAVIQFSDDGGVRFTSAALADVTAVTVTGAQGKDSLTIDHGNGLVGKAGGLTISFDGGPGKDQLILTGDPRSALTEVYTVGTTSDAGTLTLSGASASATVSFRNTSSLTDTTPASRLTFVLNDQNNFLKVEKGKPVGGAATLKLEGIDFQGQNDALDVILDDNLRPDRQRPTVVSFVPLTAAHKSEVVLETGGGDDLIVLDASRAVAGLTALTVDGGTGTDRALGDEVPRGATLTIRNVENQIVEATDDVFIERLYASRLQRPAGEGEIEYWKSVLRGPVGQAGVVALIEGSHEARTRLVKSWYESYLGRAASGSEEQFWVGLLQQGLPEEATLAQVLSSAEFRAMAQRLEDSGTPDDRVVRAFYHLLLNREASELEVRGWSDLLPGVGSAAVASGFLASPELRGRVVDAAYDSLLDRTADDSGRHFWVSSPLDFRRLRETFQSTPEVYDDNRASAGGVTFDGTGRAVLRGTSLNHRDKQFFSFTASRDATVSVVVRTTNGQMAQLEVEDAAGREVFETEPNDGVNSGRFAIVGGRTYFLRFRATDDLAAAFEADLTLA